MPYVSSVAARHEQETQSDTSAEVLPRLLKPKQVTKHYGIARTTLFDLLRSGEIPSILVNERTRLIPTEGIEAWIERSLAEQQGGQQ